MFGKILSAIKQSCLEGASRVTKLSHTRISSYLILCSILLNSAVFMGIEITNAVMMYVKKETYTVPTEHIFIFGMVLSHHIALLFTKSKDYTPPTYDPAALKGAIKKEEEAVAADKKSNVDNPDA